MRKSEVTADFAEEVTAGIEKVFHAISVMGQRHQKEGSFNQDYFGFAICSNFSYLVTADGLGSSSLAHIGAKKAVSLFEKIVIKALEDSETFNEKAFAFLLYSFHEQWLQYFGQESKQYDTTFQYIIVYDDVAICGSIGDGLLMIATNDQLLYEKKNEELFSNQTNSLANEKALGSLSMDIVSLDEVQMRSLICILATDGISDDLQPELVAQLPSYLIKQRQTQTAIKLQNELSEWVVNWQTLNHTDDRTFCFYLREKVGEVK